MKIEDILYRGRHLCGQWYFGNAIVRETDSPVPETTQVYRSVMIGDKEDGSAEGVEEETVCMYSGLCDAKEVKVFDGDIIEYLCANGLTARCVVIYENGCFCVEECGRITPARILLSSFLNNYAYNKVVGNKFDNPELLK